MCLSEDRTYRSVWFSDFLNSTILYFSLDNCSQIIVTSSFSWPRRCLLEDRNDPKCSSIAIKYYCFKTIIVLSARLVSQLLS